MVNFNALNLGNVAKGAVALGGVLIVGAGVRRALAQPKQLPPSTLARMQANIISAGKAVGGAPSAAFKGLKSLLSPSPKQPTTTPLLRAAQAAMGFSTIVVTGMILQAAKK